MKKFIGFVLVALAATGCLAVKDETGAGGGGGSGGGDVAACKADDQCDDGRHCTLDACDAEHGVCVTSQKNCDDGDASTTDWCDETKYGLCQHTVGECTGDAQCNDGIACTSDVCGADAKCKHFTDDSACSGGKTCDVDLGCVQCTTDADCNDGTACTTDACTSSHVCKHMADDDQCDDGNATTTDSCDSVAGCLHVASGVESCNGLDDDNDGQIDDGNPGGGIACQTGLAGACSAGTTKCSGGAIVCQQNVAASAEAGHCLDGIDNDCDGKTDGADQIDCPANNVEVCDGVDNDNDGFVDENNPGGGVSCSTGLLGACSAGTTLCQNGQIVCKQSNVAVAEICGNGLDDDCNGVVDNGCGGGCANGASQNCAFVCNGASSIGTQTCANNVWGGCFAMANEVGYCGDGKDNDCDGQIDNADNNCGGGNCVNGQVQTGCLFTCNGVSSVVGQQTCVNTVWGACTAMSSEAGFCGDGKDNDCDGAIDNADNNCGGVPNQCSINMSGTFSGPGGTTSISLNFQDGCANSSISANGSSITVNRTTSPATPNACPKYNGQVFPDPHPTVNGQTGSNWLCQKTNGAAGAPWGGVQFSGMTDLGVKPVNTVLQPGQQACSIDQTIAAGGANEYFNPNGSGTSCTIGN